MTRNTERLTLDNLRDLPDPCRRCLFWQLDPVHRDRVAAGTEVEHQEAWLTEVLREWGSCGRIAYVDGAPVGYALWSPAAYLPGTSALPTAPLSPDAVQLATVHVVPAAAGGGIGRILIQTMARDLIRRGDVHAVEAIATSRTPAPGRHLVPAGFLSAVGFKTQRAHPVNPRMRMDLGTALTWKDEVEQAVERLLGVVRPARARRPAPHPTPRPAPPPARERLTRDTPG